MNLLLESKVEKESKTRKRRHTVGKYIVIDSECD
jgi:hypothetical protein